MKNLLKKVKCINESCTNTEEELEIMHESYSKYTTFIKLRCPKCKFRFLVMPLLLDKYEYLVDNSSHKHEIVINIRTKKDNEKLIKQKKALIEIEKKRSAIIEDIREKTTNLDYQSWKFPY